MKNNILVGKATTTISSINGAVTQAVKNFIYSRFPKGYFKHYYVDTSLTSTNMTDKTNVNVEDENIFKNRIPSFTLSPTYNIDSDISFGNMTHWHFNHSHIFRNTKRYIGVLFDNNSHNYIWSIPNRIKLEYGVKVRFNTIMQQMDFLNYVRQSFLINEPFFVNNVRLETELPKSFLKLLMKDSNVDPESNEALNLFYKYLRKYSNKSITKKTNLSSGNTMFGYNYLTNLVCSLEGVQASNHEKEDMSETKPTVEFTFNVEFTAPASYVFESRHIQYDESVDMMEDGLLLGNNNVSYVNLVLKTEPRSYIDNKRLVMYQGFISDVNKEIDTVNIEPVIPEVIDRIVKYLLENNTNSDRIIDALLTPVLFIDNNEISNTNFKLDWTNYDVILNHPLSNMTYHIALYADLELLNAYKDKMINEKYNMRGMDITTFES